MASASNDESRATMARSLMSGYRGGPTTPLGGYGALLALYAALFLGALRISGRKRGRGWSASFLDLVLTGIATHKLTRTLTKDWVTAPLRAPFVEYKGSSIAGEVKEASRGSGLRRALGDLVTCPYCTGPWVAGALIAGLRTAPAPTRFVSAVFTAVTVSDFLHRAYELAAKVSEAAGRSSERQRSITEISEGGRLGETPLDGSRPLVTDR